MKSRSKNRGDLCKVFEPWKNYTVFAKWAKSPGYTDELVLCRNGDKGDYAPDNCRWDTQANNVEESQAKNYIVTKPCGEEISVYNLTKFSKENNLDYRHMNSVSLGKLKHHKQHKVRRVK